MLCLTREDGVRTYGKPTEIYRLLARLTTVRDVLPNGDIVVWNAMSNRLECWNLVHVK